MTKYQKTSRFLDQKGGRRQDQEGTVDRNSEGEKTERETQRYRGRDVERHGHEKHILFLLLLFCVCVKHILIQVFEDF